MLDDDKRAILER